MDVRKNTRTPAIYGDEQLKVHLARASELLPGPDYYTVLRWIHQLVRPETYIEIGIRQGGSLRCASPETICVGIDPDPAVCEVLPATARVFAVTSDTFFATQNLSYILGEPKFSLAFIDGLHLFEQALRDFINLEKWASRESIVLIHDCLPLDTVTSSRTRSSHFYSGDIWKLALCLKKYRPELKIATIRTGPTGLCVAGGLDRASTVLTTIYENCVAEFVPLTFDDYKRHLEDMPPTVDNTHAAVATFLADLKRATVGP
jgi:hypothetical protein